MKILKKDDAKVALTYGDVADFIGQNERTIDYLAESPTLAGHKFRKLRAELKKQLEKDLGIEDFFANFGKLGKTVLLKQFTKEALYCFAFWEDMIHTGHSFLTNCPCDECKSL